MLKEKKKSVIVGWAYSYCLILLIPIITIFINYYFNVRVIRQEIIRANEQILSNLKNSIDELLEDEKAFYSYIYTDEVFDSLFVHQQKGAQFYFDASRLREKLATYCEYNGGLSSLLYFIDKDYVMNTSGANESEFFYQSIKFYNHDMQDYEAWKELMTAEYNNEFLVRTFMHHKTTKECIVYADTLNHYEDNKVNIFISIPVDEIINMAKAVGGGSQFVISINGKPELAVSNGQITDSVADLKMIVDDDFFETEGYIGLRRESYDKGVSYYLLIPEKEFWKEARHTRNVLGISTSITLLMGCVCVTLLLRRNFQPVSSLLSKMGGEEWKGNEFTQIEKMYNELILKNKSMNERILNQKEIVKKNALLAMMKGRRADGLKSEDIIIDLNEYEKICLVGFEVPLSDEQLIQHDELVHFALDNIFSELMEGERFYRIEDGQYLFYLFIINQSGEENWKRNCIEKASFLCDLMEDKLGLALVSAVSNPEEELERIRFLYQDVMEAFEYKGIIGGSGVIDTETLKSDSDASAIQSSAGTMIEMALEKGDFHKMMEALEHFFESAKQRPLLVLRMQTMEVFQTVAQNFCNFVQDEEQRMHLFGYLKPLLEETNIRTVKKILEEVLIYVYASLHEQEQIGSLGIVSSIREYIGTHYMDSTLNISSIANNIGKNPKYIARVFKKETQEGILDYINRIRIDKAIALLRSGKYSVEEISARVGYATCKTFRRSFVKVMGTTPGKFETQESQEKEIE